MEYLTKAEDGESKTETTRYVHGPGIDEPLAIERKGEVYFYHADGLGSIVALTDSKGKVVQTYEYDSFGNMKQHGDKVKQPYTFTGREWDRETGLYYYRARYYDPKIGRFISFDPILHPGNGVPVKSCPQNISYPTFDMFKEHPQKFNPFIYTEDNPINITDPLGLYGTTDCSYYDRMCASTGGFYYCVAARSFPNFPWANCVRKCLQDFDAQICRDPCKRYNNFSCRFADAHSYCFITCASNSNDTPPWLK